MVTTLHNRNRTCLCLVASRLSVSIDLFIHPTYICSEALVICQGQDQAPAVHTWKAIFQLLRDSSSGGEGKLEINIIQLTIAKTSHSLAVCLPLASILSTYHILSRWSLINNQPSKYNFFFSFTVQKLRQREVIYFIQYHTVYDKAGLRAQEI